ncbi:MAG: Holliday junction resolvase RuvX [Patescibacteria group bacterium]
MKCVGIDYGTKRIGIAFSDEAGTIAFPRLILPNNRDVVWKIIELIKKEKARRIVIGKSLDGEGKENKLMGDIKEFIGFLELGINLPIFLEKEYFTSIEARRFQGGSEVDDSAAAIMLQRYLDKQKQSRNTNHIT